MVYQPIVDLATGVNGREGLIRAGAFPAAVCECPWISSAWRRSQG